MKLLGYYWVIACLLVAPPLLVQASDKAGKKGAEVHTIGCSLTHEQANASDLSIDVKFDKDVYKIEDELMLEVKPSVDAYITVIDHGSDPSRPERGYPLFSDVFVKGGDVSMFPPPNAAPLVVSGPVGANTFEIVASRYPSQTLGEQPAQQEKPKDVNHKQGDAAQRSEDAITRCTVRFEIMDK